MVGSMKDESGVHLLYLVDICTSELVTDVVIVQNMKRFQPLENKIFDFGNKDRMSYAPLLDFCQNGLLQFVPIRVN